MGALSFRDYRTDPAGWARELNISREAVELYLTSDVIDLHIDSYIWQRIFGYDLMRRHSPGVLGGRFFRQVDFPRIREAAIGGGVWVITTNPARFRSVTRTEVFLQNLKAMRETLAQAPEDFALVRTAREYVAARKANKHAAFLAVQGGSALDRDLDALDLIPDGELLLITLVHLYSSSLGVTSAPGGARRGEGLSPFGRDFVRRLNEKKIFVDLAHISRQGFWDAVEVHDPSQPLMVSHTGVSGVHPHWRNIDDDQLKAVAKTGGTVGIMYQGSFLGARYWSWNSAKVVDHIEHIVRTVGEDHASLGSDWDGAVVPPRDMPTCLELPVLVQRMLDRGFAPHTIQKILGGNFLRVLEALRG